MPWLHLEYITWSLASRQVLCVAIKALLCLTGWFGMVIMALVTSNKVQLRQARLVLGLVTIFGGSTIPVFSWPTQPGHHFVSRCNESCWCFRPLIGKKRQILHSSGPCYQDCWHTGLFYASLIGFNHGRTARLSRPEWPHTEMVYATKSAIPVLAGLYIA